MSKLARHAGPSLTTPFFWIVDDRLVVTKNIGKSPQSPEISTLRSNIILSEFNPFVHKCIIKKSSPLHGKGLFSVQDLPAGTEIMRLPALVSSGGSHPEAEKVLKCVYHTIDALNSALQSNATGAEIESNFWRDFRSFYSENILALQSKDWKPLSHQMETKLMEEKGQHLQNYLRKFSMRMKPNELAAIYISNRFSVTRSGKSYCAMFPSASWYNHDCDPNVDLEIITPSNHSSYSPSLPSSTCVLIARTSRKVLSGEELFINYLPDSGLSLQQKGDKMLKRWGFQCSCRNCQIRLARCALVLFLVFGIVFLNISTNLRRKVHQEYG